MIQHHVRVVLRLWTLYNVDMVIYLFVNDYIAGKEEETYEYRSKKCNKGNR